MSLDRVNWYRVFSNAVTAIRSDWSVEKLIRLHLKGNDTPVSGDILQRYKH